MKASTEVPVKSSMGMCKTFRCTPRLIWDQNDRIGGESENDHKAHPERRRLATGVSPAGDQFKAEDGMQTDDFAVLVDLTEACENKHDDLGLADPAEAAKFRMEREGRSLAPQIPGFPVQVVKSPTRVGDDGYQPVIHSAMREDSGIATLVELHDQIIDQGNGFWIKIEAWRVQATRGMASRHPLFADLASTSRPTNPGLRQRSCRQATAEVQVRGNPYAV